MKWVAWAAGLVALLAFVGCGGGDAESTASTTAATRSAPSESPPQRPAKRPVKRAETSTGSAEKKNPASTAPDPEPAEPSAEPAQSWKAIGQRACQGMTPLEAALHFKASAKEAGAEKRFIELVTKPSQEVEQSPGYPRLVAALYSTTLPVSRRAAAASGCAEELAAHG